MRLSKRARRPEARVTPIHALLGAAILGLLVMPIAFAGAKPPAETSKESLKKQIKSLSRRVAALESRQAPSAPNALPPIGPAGGVLMGSYPNPRIAPNSITPDDIAPHSIGADQIATGGVDRPNLEIGAVAAEKLAQANLSTSPPVTVQPGTSQQAIATCTGDSRLLGGGLSWQNNTDGTAVVLSSPVQGSANTKWVVEGRVDAGGTANTLFAEALCLEP